MAVTARTALESNHCHLLMYPYTLGTNAQVVRSKDHSVWAVLMLMFNDDEHHVLVCQFLFLFTFSFVSSLC